MHIGFQNRFLLLALVDVLLAKTNDHAQRLDIEPIALGFGIHVPNIVGDRLLLFLETFDALDKRFELLFGEAAGGLIVLDGGCSSHWALRGAVFMLPPAFEAAPP